MANDQCPEPETSGWKKGVVSIQTSKQAKYRKLYFCVKFKRYSEDAIDRGKWMSGMYNIYMSGHTCPDGMYGVICSGNKNNIVHVPCIKATCNNSLVPYA